MFQSFEHFRHDSQPMAEETLQHLSSPAFWRLALEFVANVQLVGVIQPLPSDSPGCPGSIGPGNSPLFGHGHTISVLLQRVDQPLESEL
jgi:hypothetical protein